MQVEQTAIYVVTAYRWGWSNNDWYIVHAGLDGEAADEAAERECEERGGKYGVQVVRHVADEETPVNYFPSTYGEKAPHDNWRIDAAGHIGIEVLSAVEDGTALLPKEGEPGFLESKPVEIPAWLREKVEHWSAIAKVMCKEGTDGK